MSLKTVFILLIVMPFMAPPSWAAETTPSPLPATLARALEGAELDTKDGWAFRQTLTVHALDEPGTTAVTRWDPSKPAGERCSVVSVTTGDGKESDKNDACKDGHERETYGDVITMLRGATVETVSEDDQRAVYSFVPAGDEHGVRTGGLHVDVDEEDAKRMIGTLEVVKAGPGAPYLGRFALRLKDPAGNLLARLKKLNIVYDFAPEGDSGAKLLRGMNVDLQLSVFTMFNVTTEISMRFDEYRKVK